MRRISLTLHPPYGRRPLLFASVAVFGVIASLKRDDNFSIQIILACLGDEIFHVLWRPSLAGAVCVQSAWDEKCQAYICDYSALACRVEQQSKREIAPVFIKECSADRF